MRVYEYEAVVPDGRTVHGEVGAESPAAVPAIILERGLTLVDFKERKTGRSGFVRERISIDEVIEFTMSMESMIQAGIPLLNVLEDLIEQSEKKSWKKVLGDVRCRIEDGSTVSEALAAHPGIFDDLYVNIVAAGEESGNLHHSFKALAAHMERNRSMRQELRRMLSYPTMVFGALFAFTSLLTFFVFPRLGGLFTSMEIEVPLPTKIMLVAGNIGVVALPIGIVLLVLSIAVYPRLRRSPRFRMGRDTLLMRMPIAGNVVKMATYSRMAGTLSTLISSGIQLDRALGMTRFAVGNMVISRAIERTREQIQGGATLSESLEREGHFPRMVIRMATVGETSGDLPGMLGRLSEYYDREMPNLFQKTVAAINPILIVTLVIIVGFAALAVFLPLMEITTSITN